MVGLRRAIGIALAVTALVPATALAHDEAGTQTLLAALQDPFNGTAANNDNPSVFGQFSAPFTEPTIDGQSTDKKCIENGGDSSATSDERHLDCKPTAASVNILPNDTVMYYDGLEGTENIRTSVVVEYGHNAGNDQSRVLDLSGPSPTWTIPHNPDGGANPKGYQNDPLFPRPLSTGETYNDGALFCSDNKFLADGRVISLGGTAYYLDPGVSNGTSAYGISELEGLRSSRIFSSSDGWTWDPEAEMHYGRWYPTAITLPSGNLMVASGVTKLLKPVYPSHPEDSGTNVKQTETYDLLHNRWTLNPASASRSLPLFPRLHLLPDGRVFYNAAGQAFNPFGQAYDEATWNEAAVYDPKTQAWTDLGIPGASDGSPIDPSGDLGNPAGDLQGFGIPGGGSAFTIPGFRGSAFSIMLPLKAPYAKATFLTAGGVLNPPSPGSYFATSDARLTTVDTSGGADKMTTKPTGDLAEPRWYASGVLLPTGQVLAFNGSDRDEVAGPGVEYAVQKTEMWDPATGKWSTLASSHQPRTYHNTAALLPDGRVLIGGHAPIPTLYLNDTTLPGGFAPHDGRDPSFEIFTPPYLEWGKDLQPHFTTAPERIEYGADSSFEVATSVPADEIQSVVLVRNPSVTHLIDADQRNVELQVLKRRGNTLKVAAPPNRAVAPPGPYMLFVNRKTAKGLVPSVSTQTFVGLHRLESLSARAGN